MELTSKPTKSDADNTKLDADKLKDEDFIARINDNPADLVYFCLNVGDGDAQVIVLPESVDTVRRVIVVDAGHTTKVAELLTDLEEKEVVSFKKAETIALVVATHPHHDHIAGMAKLFRQYGEHVAEFWEPGYFHTTASYQNMMREVAAHENIVYTQPTSGMRRFFGLVAVTVLSPSIHLRNRFDTYGVEINDASISLRIEHPTPALASVQIARGVANQPSNPASAKLILGADAQTLSWSFVATDFPYLARSNTVQAQAIAAAQGGNDLLRADVLKVSHHASKHGVNLELVERIRPKFTLVSCADGNSSYGFPHHVAQEIIREALNPIAKSGGTHDADAKLGIFYTGDTIRGGEHAGSIAVVLRGRRRELWRFKDKPSEKVELAKAHRWDP